MKRRISLLLTLIVSIVIGIRSVGAVNMYVKCNYNCESTECGFLVTEHAGANRFAIITNQKGEIGYYGLEARVNDAYLWPLENDYDNGSDIHGCWLKNSNGYNGAATCNNKIAYSNKSPKDILLKGMCPKCVCCQPWSGPDDSGQWEALDRFFSQELVPQGEGSVEKIETFQETTYVVYKFIDNKNNEKIFIEGYVGDEGGKPGAYAFVGPHVDAFWWVDGIPTHQLNMIDKFDSNFWKVHEIDETRLIFENMDINGEKNGSTVNVCKGLSAAQCKSQHGYEVLITNNDKNNKNSNLWKVVSDWLDENELETTMSSNDIFSVMRNSKLNDTCKDINSNMAAGKNYNLDNNYNIEKLVTDLETAYKALKVSYEQGFSYKDYTNQGGKTEVSDSMVTKVYADVLGVFKLTDLMYVDADASNSWKYHINEQHLIDALQRDVKYILQELVYGDSAVPEINIININDYLNDYALLYFTTVSYIDSNVLLFGLDSNLAKRVELLRINFEKLVQEHKLNMYPVVDCKGLLTQSLIDKINSYLNVVKIIIPIILIGYGIIDFTKAIFGGEDDMKKAQKLFFKRIGIAVIIFITPTIVNLLLNLANKVWPIITPNTCGLFE